MRSLFEKVKIEQANRAIKDIKNTDLITCADIVSVIDKLKVEEKKIARIGFAV